MDYKLKLKIAISLFIFFSLFTSVSFVVQMNMDFFRSLVINHYIIGMFLFVFLIILSIVFAPLTSLPFLPLASNTYGVFLTSLFFIIGGFIGSIIAFFIARKFKSKIIGKMISTDEANLIEDAVPKKNYFWILILMRIFVPADVLSYSLGMTSITPRIFILTTLIGIIPSAIFFSLLGITPWIYQIIVWIFVIFILVFGLYILFRNKKNKTINPDELKTFIQ